LVTKPRTKPVIREIWPLGPIRAEIRTKTRPRQWIDLFRAEGYAVSYNPTHNEYRLWVFGPSGDGWMELNTRNIRDLISILDYSLRSLMRDTANPFPRPRDELHRKVTRRVKQYVTRQLVRHGLLAKKGTGKKVEKKNEV